MALLQVESLNKHFGGIRAVDDCSFAVEPGSITALIGPNGAGKTTVFNLITGIHRPDGGHIRFAGEPIERLAPHRIARRGLGRTFQICRDLQELSVLENLVLCSQTGGWMDLFKGSILRHEYEHALELLDFVGIAHLAHAKAKGLSHGQKKLMELAAVLMARPRMILLDEPAGGVNPALMEKIVAHIRTLNEQGITFLIVEHNMELVMNLCDPVVVMAYGHCLAQGAPAEVQRDEQVLAAYLGDA